MNGGVAWRGMGGQVWWMLGGGRVSVVDVVKELKAKGAGVRVVFQI